MRLHDRYLFRELLTPLAACIGAFLIIGVSFFFQQQLNTIHERKLTSVETVAFCAASLPELIVVVLPILLLLTFLYVLTNHARHNEITALRAAGVGLWRLCVPYFIAGLIATGIYFVVNELVVPACDEWSQEIFTRHVKKDSDVKSTVSSAKGFVNNRANRIWRFAQYDPASTLMMDPTVKWSLPDGSWHAVWADHAMYTNGVWTFLSSGTNFDVHLFAQVGAHGDLMPAGSTNELAIPQFDETPQQIRLLLEFADSQVLRGSGYADIPLSELWKLMQLKQDLRPHDVNAVETKFYGRLAMPWTCFVVVLMAIPFGAQSGRRNLFFGVAGSIFIGFGYFVLQRISLALGMNGQLPGWLAAWLPNMVFALAGFILTLRVR